MKRDFGTTNELFYNKQMKTETLINPHFYHGNNTLKHKLTNDMPKVIYFTNILRAKYK